MARLIEQCHPLLPLPQTCHLREVLVIPRVRANHALSITKRQDAAKALSASSVTSALPESWRGESISSGVLSSHVIAACAACYCKTLSETCPEFDMQLGKGK